MIGQIRTKEILWETRTAIWLAQPQPRNPKASVKKARPKAKDQTTKRKRKICVTIVGILIALALAIYISLTFQVQEATCQQLQLYRQSGRADPAVSPTPSSGQAR